MLCAIGSIGSLIEVATGVMSWGVAESLKFIAERLDVIRAAHCDRKVAVSLERLRNRE